MGREKGERKEWDEKQMERVARKTREEEERRRKIIEKAEQERQEELDRREALKRERENPVETPVLFMQPERVMMGAE